MKLSEEKVLKKVEEEKMLRQAMEQHAASGAAWDRDFGDRPVYDYNTFKKIANKASDYRKKQK